LIRVASERRIDLAQPANSSPFIAFVIFADCDVVIGILRTIDMTAEDVFGGRDMMAIG